MKTTMQSILDITRKARLLPIAFSAIIAMGLVSCSDDDEDKNNNGSSTAGLIATNGDGDRIYLTAVGNMKFNYDSDMKLTKIGTYDVTYNPFHMTYTSSYSMYKEEESISNISVNKNGYITHLKYNWKQYKDDEVYEDENNTFDFSYDSNGHLTKIKASYSLTGDDDGTKYKESGSGTMSITWSNGLMKKGTYNYSGSDGTKETETYTFDYNDNGYENATYQYTFSLCDVFFGDFVGLYVLGYMGKGPVMHPVGLTEVCKETYDGDTEESTEEYRFSYQLNSNGTVRSCRINKESNKTYTYTTRSDASYAPAAFVPAQQQTVEKSESMFRSILKKHHKHGSLLVK